MKIETSSIILPGMRKTPRKSWEPPPYKAQHTIPMGKWQDRYLILSKMTQREKLEMDLRNMMAACVKTVTEGKRSGINRYKILELDELIAKWEQELAKLPPDTKNG